MAGVVGGSVGDGEFSGTVIDYCPGPTTLITAIYHFGGSRHDFTARMHVEQTGLHAVLVGVVTDGGARASSSPASLRPDHVRVTAGATDCFTGYLTSAGPPATDAASSVERREADLPALRPVPQAIDSRRRLRR